MAEMGITVADQAPAGQWFPLAALGEVTVRHIFHTQLLGEELAIWRADDGFVNVWKNRCPHRGVRLTLGTNSGSELLCRYHGLRFTSRTGQCAFVPAHPDRTPAKVLCVKRYGSMERYGFIWATLDDGANVYSQAGPEDIHVTTLRSLPFDAPVGAVAEALARGYRFQPIAAPNDAQEADTDCAIEMLDAFTIRVTASHRGGSTTVMLFPQPVDDARTVVHACVLDEVPQQHRLAVLRHHNDCLARLRDIVEASPV